MADYSGAYSGNYEPSGPVYYSTFNALEKRVRALEDKAKKGDTVNKVSALNVIAETELQEAYERIAKLEKEKAELIGLIGKLREAGNEMALVLRDATL